MDESFETFEEELGKPVQDVPPPKPIRQARAGSRAASLRKALSIQNLTQIETPWEGVTLNRCLIVAITILLLTSGLQRIHEAVRGRKDEELSALNERHNLIKRGKITPHEPDSSLWELLFWWFDDDDEGSSKSKRANRERVSRSLRHRTLPDLRLLKTRGTRFTERRARGRREEDEIKERPTRRKEKEMKVKKKREEEEEEMKKPVKESKQKPVRVKAVM
ncbi:unnamed protein product [Leuciscus chuanchicus]